MTPKLPVYERMRSPIRPPAPKAFNRPIIRAVKWRKVVDNISTRILSHAGTIPLHEEDNARVCLAYIEDWIEHAEGILNGELHPDTPFFSQHARRNTYLKTPRWDPHHAHPAIKLFDYTFNDDKKPS